MIDDAMRFLLGALNAHLDAELGRDPEPYAVLSALVAPDGTPAQGIEQRVILALVNVERDTTAGPAAPHVVRRSAEGLVRTAAPLSLNLYLLMAVHHPRYPEALRRLATAIGFLQANPAFDARGAGEFPAGVDRLTLEMVSLDFHALNNLWATVGAKYLPSVVLKLRMLTVDGSRAEERVPRITAVEANVAPRPSGRAR